MKRDNLILWALFWVCLISAILIAPALRSAEPVQQPQLAVPPAACAMVFVMDKDGTRSGGSSALIGPRLVVTANHVVKERKSNSVEVVFPSWERVNGTIVHTDKARDLAYVRLVADPQTAKPLELGDVSYENRSVTPALSVNGYGYGPFQQTWGRLSTKRWSDYWCSIDGADARSGDSGGPIIDKHGRYAGTLWGSVDGDTYFTPVATVISIAVKKRLVPEPPKVVPTDDSSYDLTWNER